MNTKRVFLLIISILPLIVLAETVTEFPQVLINDRVPAGNYSGIVAIGTQTQTSFAGNPVYENDYAIVSDKAPYDGFYVWHIQQDHEGAITASSIDTVGGLRHGDIQNTGFNCDYEGVAYFPEANTVFISDEATQGIYEYNLNGLRTGRAMTIPEAFTKAMISPNYGFESLTYSQCHRRFFTTTENTLKADGEAASNNNRVPARLRIQAFDEELQPREQYIYETDTPRVTLTEDVGAYAFGVPALLADDKNGSLLVLEREAIVCNKKSTEALSKTKVYNKLYRVYLNSTDDVLQKTLLIKWNTDGGAFSMPTIYVPLANYEGMGWGATLADGRRTILFVNDSQNRESRTFANITAQVNDFLKVIVLTPEEGDPVWRETALDEIALDTHSWIVITPLGQITERGTGDCPYPYMHKTTPTGLRVYIK